LAKMGRQDGQAGRCMWADEHSGQSGAPGTWNMGHRQAAGLGPSPLITRPGRAGRAGLSCFVHFCDGQYSPFQGDSKQNFLWMFGSRTGRCATRASLGGAKQVPKGKRRFLLEGKDVVRIGRIGRLLQLVISCLAGVYRVPIPSPLPVAPSQFQLGPPPSLLVSAAVPSCPGPSSPQPEQFPAIPGRIRAAPITAGYILLVHVCFGDLATRLPGQIERSILRSATSPLSIITSFTSPAHPPAAPFVCSTSRGRGRAATIAASRFLTRLADLSRSRQN
jgi:hypothetical protein